MGQGQGHQQTQPRLRRLAAVVKVVSTASKLKAMVFKFVDMVFKLVVGTAFLILVFCAFMLLLGVTVTLEEL